MMKENYYWILLGAGSWNIDHLGDKYILGAFCCQVPPDFVTLFLIIRHLKLLKNLKLLAKFRQRVGTIYAKFVEHEKN